MRYIVLPLIIIGYILWTYFTIKELNRCKWKIGPAGWRKDIYAANYAVFWILIHFAIVVEAIIVCIAHYW
jgi:hypothetical protein